jgi:hypothetical protein
VVPVNPKSGTIFDYESVTSIAAIARLCRASVANPTDARENRFGLAFEPAIEDARSDNLSDVRFRDRRGT